jgi:ABC-type amino acid transport substrate-binding protein
MTMNNDKFGDKTMYPLQCPAISSPLRRRTVLHTGAAALAAALCSGASWAELADLRERGSLKVALYRANLPFSDANAQSGAVGADAALAKALAERLKLGVQWLPFEAGENMGDDLRNMVWRGHYLGYGPADVLMQVPIDKHLISETRQVEFLLPYYRQRLVWLSAGTPSSSDLRAQALDGISLGAETGTAAASALLGFGGGRWRTAVKLAPTGLEVAQGVVSGKWQAAYVTQAQAEAAIKGLPNRAEYVIEAATLPGTPPNGWVVGMAIKAGQPELAQAMAQAFKSLQDDGSLAAIWRDHGLTWLTP